MLEPIQEDIKKIIWSKRKTEVTPWLDKVRVREILENEEICVPILTDLLKNSFQQAVVDKMKISVLRPVYVYDSVVYITVIITYSLIFGRNEITVFEEYFLLSKVALADILANFFHEKIFFFIYNVSY